MVSDLNNYWGLMLSDIKKIWQALGVPQKIAIIALLLVSGVIISYFVTKSTEPNWGVLYSDLSGTDSAAVIENLKKAGYAYKLSDDGKSILVPSDQKDDLRLMIAENDVIKDSNPGFELLDKMQLGATDFQNKLTKQRIFQDELTRTIERIRGVKKARVQLADPERSIFSDKDEVPSASVMLILEPGFTIKPDQVKAIKNLVAYGVPRLTPDKVFITDQNGTPLSDDINGNSNDINDFRSNYEKNITKKVSDVIEKLVGNNNFSVQVSATMNFDSAKATIEQYIPSTPDKNNPEGIVNSQQTESETYDNANKAPNGLPKDIAAQNANSKSTNYQKSKTTKNFNVSKEIKQIVYAPGTVQRMTIAVALNKVLTTKEKDELKNLIISASGADETRGDIINITGMQFADDQNSASAKAMQEINKDSRIQFWINNIAPLAVVLILGLAALFVINSFIKRSGSVEEQVYEGDHYYDEPETEEEQGLLEAASIPALEAKLEPELERMRSDLNNMILSDPGEAARLILSFIKE